MSKTAGKAELEARESREKTAARHSAAEAFMAAFVMRYGVTQPTATEAKQMATAAYFYAAALIEAREALS